MPKATYQLSTKKNSIGECQIIMRFYLYGSSYLRAKSSIWVDPRRWGKKNNITIPSIEGEEQSSLLKKKESLRRLTIYLEDEITATKDKTKIDRTWGENAVRAFFEPPKEIASTTKEKTFFEVAEHSLSVRKMSEVRQKNFKVLLRCLRRFEMYKSKTTRTSFVLSFSNLNVELLRQFEDFLGKEQEIFKKYPDIYDKYPYSAKLVALTPTRKRPPRLDKDGNVIPKRMPLSRGLNSITDMMTRLRTFVLWAYNNNYTTTDPFKHYRISEPVYGTPIYITNEERKQLLATDLSDDKDLEAQRDIFVFQCLIGCRVSDLYSMTTDSIVNGAIEYIARKTIDERAETIRVPLNKTASALLEKYAEGNRKSLFPFKTQQHYNRKIKEAFKRAGLDRMVTTLDQKSRLEIKVPLYELASSHMARRTFTGNIYKKVRDQNLCSALTGHKIGSKAFARYREVDDEMKKEMVDLLD